MKRVNLILMGKGGVGKSLISLMIAQYLKSHGHLIYCADTDPVNATFSMFKALEVEHINICDQSMQVDARRFDVLIDRLLTHEGESVIDNGASSFLPLVHYLNESETIRLLEEAGCKVVIHAPLVGGAASRETIAGLKAILDSTPADVVVWENEYFGSMLVDGVRVADTPAFKKYNSRILGTINLVNRTESTFGKDMQTMLQKRLTFEEALASDELFIIPKQRLTMVRRDIFSQLENIGF